MIHQYYIIYKPFGMVTRFGKEEGKQSLSDLGFDFPKDVYPVGRLDADSEGLLLLSNDKQLNHLLLNPSFGHNRTYLAQVEGIITEEAIHRLQEGVSLRIDGKEYFTKKASVRKIEPGNLPPRNPPIRFRISVPDCWIELKITEGKNRQVRRMCAAVGFPVLRLIRTSIEDLSLPKLEPGMIAELKKEDIYKSLKLI